MGSQLEAGAVARVVPARPEHAGSIQAEVDAVSGERRWNFSLRAPSLEEIRANLVQHLASDSPYFVALDGGKVVGHCEIQRSLRPGTWHVGLLGMGLIEPYRGRWIGARLVSTCLAAAWAVGMLRVELEVFSDNARARRLFGRAGFREEGVRHAARIIDGLVQDSLVMARLAPSIRELEAPGGWEHFFELAARAPRYRQHSWVSDAVAVASSPIHGRGLFATRPIPDGELVAVMGGQVLGPRDFDDFRLHHPCYSAVAIDEGQHLVLDHGALQFGNHSHDPNLWMGDEVTILARRGIDIGEELTIDYALQRR